MTSKASITLRINDIDFEKSKEIAKRDMRSWNNLIETIIRKYIDEYEAINGEINIDSL